METLNFIWGGGIEPKGDKTFSGYLQRYVNNINDLMWLKWDGTQILYDISVRDIPLL